MLITCRCIKFKKKQYIFEHLKLNVAVKVQEICFDSPGTNRFVTLASFCLHHDLVAVQVIGTELDEVLPHLADVRSYCKAHCPDSIQDVLNCIRKAFQAESVS